MMDLAITGRIVTTDGINESTICIKDGRIVKIGEERQSIHLSDSSLIFPGFIDAHVHLREDPSQQWSYKEDFLTASRAAVHGGVTTVADMPNNPLPAISKESIKEKIELSKKAIINILFYGGVVSENLQQLKEFSDLVCGYKIYAAETTGKLILKEEDMEDAIRVIAETGKSIVFHCEVNDLEKILGLGKKYNAKTHIAHVSKKSEIEIIKQYKDKMQLTCETCPHYLFFTRDNFKQKVKPEIGNQGDRSALLEALKNGTIDILATDHAPHTIEDKVKGASGFPGLDTYGNFVAWLLNELKPEQIVRLTSKNPAKLLGINNRGIEEGAIANLTILDMQKTTIKKEDLQTKCRWSPFEGYEFPGQAVYTIYHGKLLMNNKNIQF